VTSRGLFDLIHLLFFVTAALGLGEMPHKMLNQFASCDLKC